LVGQRSLALLAYLLLTGQAHSRQHLTDLLFEGPSDPRGALRWNLSRLRSAIGAAYFLADREEIAFNFAGDYWLDVAEFESGELELYRGDLLEGLSVHGAYAFEDWLLFERERLRGHYQAALERRLAEQETRGDSPGIVETAHQLLRLDNLREDWHRALMRAYARLGKREAALAQYAQCRQVLQAELGVEPVAETVALAEAIQKGRFEALPPGLEQRLLIAGRFAVDELESNLVGRGGMGEVYRGTDTHSGQPVAIKVIRPDLVAGQPDLVQRFRREGEALRRLDHPNIVKMLAAAEQEGHHYLVMEYVAGGSLEDLLRCRGSLPVERTLEIALDLTDALTRAHHLGIIHRDLKPANVLLTPQGLPRLTDFGLARWVDRPGLTESGMLLGTWDYLSPEACQGKRLDARADIWALGVLLYEMLAGQPPFQADSATATLTAILTQPVPNLVQQRPDVSLALADLVYHMLEKDPERRIASARLVGAELEAIQKGGVPALRRAEPVTTLQDRHVPPLAVLPLPRFSTSLVGRAGELETLRRAWQRAAAGNGQIVLVEGEPGVGKTRLIEELLAEVAQQALILRAKCPEMQDPLAYTLFVDPLRQAMSGERPPGVSDTWLAELARLLPELRDRYPNLPQPAQLDPSAERRRLFDAVCAFLLALTAERPLALFLDDLQWADPTSLELLHHFAERIGQTPVLILVACHPFEVAADHPLHTHRPAWERTGHLTSLSLEPLKDKAVNDLLQELTPWTGDNASFGDLIYRETRGNPLFVVETVASLREEGRLPENAEGWQRDFWAEQVTIPRQVQMVIERRLNRLDEVSRQVLTASAVMQGSFGADLAQAVSGRSEMETLDSLERLLARRLLVEQGPDELNFSHDKIREVAYGGLSQLRRKLLHRRAAENMEQRYRGRAKALAERLAYHYERAGIEEKALEYHILAGHRAWEQFAFQAAIEHYQKALALLPVNTSEVAETSTVSIARQIELYRGLGDALSCRGQNVEAAQAYAALRAAAEAAGDMLAQAQAGGDSPACILIRVTTGLRWRVPAGWRKSPKGWAPRRNQSWPGHWA
jgi:DNA-binding SARP family transcriptional activator